MTTVDWSALESLMRRDPGGRGLAAVDFPPSIRRSGQLEGAARSLAEHGQSVAIVTGFCVIGADPPAAETDGPPGAIYMDFVLRGLGREVRLISDSYATPLLAAGCRVLGLDANRICEMPLEPPQEAMKNSLETRPTPLTDRWVEEFLDGPGRGLTHLVAIERAGPSHTLASLRGQPRRRPAPVHEFEQLVGPADRDLCHNMRGQVIADYTANAHRLFERAGARASELVTIGIGDGGNELGMGSIPWEDIGPAVLTGEGHRIACRIATDYLLIAGVSNWGGYALATAVAILAGRRDLLAPLNSTAMGDLISTLVREAGAVDGVTRRREATVDGIPLPTYLEILTGIRRAAGLST